MLMKICLTILVICSCFYSEEYLTNTDKYPFAIWDTKDNQIINVDSVFAGYESYGSQMLSSIDGKTNTFLFLFTQRFYQKLAIVELVDNKFKVSNVFDIDEDSYFYSNIYDKKNMKIYCFFEKRIVVNQKTVSSCLLYIIDIQNKTISNKILIKDNKFDYKTAKYFSKDKLFSFEKTNNKLIYRIFKINIDKQEIVFEKEIILGEFGNITYSLVFNNELESIIFVYTMDLKTHEIDKNGKSVFLCIKKENSDIAWKYECPEGYYFKANVSSKAYIFKNAKYMVLFLSSQTKGKKNIMIDMVSGKYYKDYIMSEIPIESVNYEEKCIFFKTHSIYFINEVGDSEKEIFNSKDTLYKSGDYYLPVETHDRYSVFSLNNKEYILYYENMKIIEINKDLKINKSAIYLLK